VNILELTDITLKKNDKVLLDSLSMELWEGHVHAVIGPNGAGKSTLANTIMGLSGYRDFSGDILYRGTSIRALGIDERARLGLSLVFQEPARFEGLGVPEFVLAGAKDKSTKTLDRALEMVGLDPMKYKTRAVDKTLSGGERKRIELDYGALCEKDSVVEMKTRIFGRNADRIHIREAATLKGESSVGVLTSHIALKDKSSAVIESELIADAPYARGHVDCKEIVQGEARARAVPIVQVNDRRAHVTHEAAIGSVDSKQLETLMSRGLTEDEATDLIIEGLLR
jgi:ABC-type lipopolysaccharide export system ATPase subunit